MGLTFESTKNSSMTDIFTIEKKEYQYIIALAGNPNTGKSTVFNSLTGLHQHTGNWPGKTVVNARGEFTYNNRENILVDLPGTYSLFASSVEEEVARDFICFGNSDAVIVVADATCLERNLNLVYQIMELTQNVILCINLIDEAKKKNIVIDGKGIEKELGIPVILCSARSEQGISELKEAVYKVTTGKLKPSPKTVIYDDYIEEKIKSIEPLVKKNITSINSRWLSLRIIDGDKKLLDSISNNIDNNSLEEILDIVNESNSHDKIETLGMIFPKKFINKQKI
ncbi:Fe2+ transport system protein B [Clostridium beijerinckii]|nr:Fe2+ transport system protein B [Clostridium beijerinckii]